VCPPVGATSQAQILEHYRRVIEATEFPIAVYQLPQVTRCEVDAKTMSELMKTGRIHMFKDTSGEDRVAASRVLGDSVWTLRGAEGGYFEALKPGGAYDGWLLSTANGLAEHYRAIRDMATRGDRESAQTLSARVTRAVNAIFELGNQMNLGNVFSNANRAIDHVQAYGARCVDVPMPYRIDGSTVPEPYVVQVSAIVRREGLARVRPYLG